MQEKHKMKKLLALTTTLTASPALAHQGAHLHPHEAAHWLPLVLGLAALAGTAVYFHVRGRK